MEYLNLIPELAVFLILIISLLCIVLKRKKKAYGHNKVQLPSHRGANITLYIISLVAIWAGLLVPFYRSGETLSDRMLLYYIASTVNVIVGKNVFSGYWVKGFTEACNYTFLGNNIKYTFFGNEINIYAHLILIYALVAVFAVIYLFFVILSKRNYKNSATLSFIIEEFIAVDLAIYIMLNLCSIISPTWNNYGVLIAFGGVLVVMIVRSFINKGSLGAVKFFLLLLSVIGVLSLYDITAYIPLLAKPLRSLAKMMQSTVGFIGLYEGYIFITYYLFNFSIFLDAIKGFSIPVSVELIFIVLASTMAILNLFIDIIGLSTHSKRNDYGKLLRHKGAKVYGLVRYLIEFAAALASIILAFANKEDIGIYLYLLAIVSLIQTIISVVRLARLGSKVYNKTTPKKIKKTKKIIVDNRLVFNDELLHGDYYEEIEVVSPLYQGATVAAAGNTNYVPVNKNYEGFRDIVQVPHDIYNDYYAGTPQNGNSQNGGTYPQTNGENNEQTRTIIYTARTIYNGPRDRFIDGLTDEQKVEFCKVFLEKSMGTLPEMPSYVVNGDNIEFFRSVFSRLNTFKGIISEGLLDKIYQEIITTK